MKRFTLVAPAAVCLLAGLAAPLLAAEATGTDAVGEENISPAAPAEECRSDLRSFDSQIQKDGYWLGGYGAGDPGLGDSGYGYGYPLGGYGFGYSGYGGYSGYSGDPAQTSNVEADYFFARPGYEIRILIATAEILARHGQQQSCEDVLATTRDHYEQYVADMESAGMPMANVPGWQQHQIALAVPVASTTDSFRSDQLLGADVRNPKYEALGSVDDIVISPQTGKIAYLMVARGGWIFGMGDKYVPVPWEAFKVTPNVTLLVLDAAKSTMDAAPQVNSAEFTTLGQASQEVDAYWNALK